MPQTKEQHRLYMADRRLKQTDSEFNKVKKLITKKIKPKTIKKAIKKSIKVIDEYATKDDIEKYQNSQVKQHKPKKSIIPIDDELGEDLDIEFDRTRDDLGIGKHSNKVKPQYEKTDDSYNYDFWGNKQSVDNPLDKVSNQENMRKMFGDRAES